MARQNTDGTALVRRPAETVTRWDPWSEVDRVQRQMDEVFGRFLGLTPVSRLIPALPGVDAGALELSPDIYETNEAIVFVFAMPGIDPGNLNIEATAETLTIRGERKPFYENEKATRHRQSFWTSAAGTFQASYDLPAQIEPNSIVANYRNGVLELHLPKVEASKPKAVKVNIASGS